ncbi:MAG: hypothetical protein ACLFR2_13045 [Candidatus Kapaibacterium sp.]
MDLLIAILWHIQVLVPNTYVSYEEFDHMVTENEPVIQDIQNDEEQTQYIMHRYESEQPVFDLDPQLIEEWDKKEEEPIKD